MHRGTILPIVLMAFAIVAFLVLVNYAVTQPTIKKNSNASPIVDVAEIMKNPQLYNGKNICIRGSFKSENKISSFQYLTETGIDSSIFVEAVIPDGLVCTGIGTDKVCVGVTMICGIFTATTDDQTGFGPENKYRYRLEEIGPLMN